MRWNAFAATLSADDHSRFVNLLTAGRGYVHVAARLATTNADARTVVAQVDQALRAFASVGVFLPRAGPALDGSEPQQVESAQVPSLPWQEFLGTRALAEARQATAALDEAVAQARGAAAVVKENGEVSALARRLAASVASLQLVRQLCQVILNL